MNLRSAIIVGIEYSVRTVLCHDSAGSRGESANLLSVGAVDFGIIVDSAVILVENIFRNLQRDQAEKNVLAGTALRQAFWGPDPTRSQENSAEPHGWTDRLRLILISAMQVDKAVFFSALITVAGFVPLFTMQGVEGQIFGPMARTYGYALAGALIATFTITPPLASVLLPEQVKRDGDDHRAGVASSLRSGAALRAEPSRSGGGNRNGHYSGNFFADCAAAWQRISAASGGGQFLDSRLHADHTSRCKTARRPREKCARFFCGTRK